MVLRHPFLMAIDEKYIEDNLRRIRAMRGKQYVSFPYKFDRRGPGELRPVEIIDIEISEYRKGIEGARRYLAHELPRIQRSDDQLAAWNKELAKRWPRHREHLELQIILVEWMRQRRPPKFMSGEMDLAEAFAQYALGLGALGGANNIRLRVNPRGPKGALIRLAIELQAERDFDELFYEYAPRVTVFVLSILPVGSAGVVVALTFEAIMGFIDFMYAMHDAERDGIITEQEADEAWWNLIGILPFKIIQVALMGRAIGEVGIWFLQQLWQALREFWADLEALIDSVLAGWNQGLRMDPSNTIFLPDHCLALDG